MQWRRASWTRWVSGARSRNLVRGGVDDEATTLAAAIRQRPVTQLAETFERAGVWAEICRPNGERDSLDDASLERLGTVYGAEHPQYGAVRQIGPLVRLSGSSAGARTHAPLPGEHTDEILGELGYAAAAVADLRARKIVK